jgi:ketosteroid isomerase-like protein
MSSPNVEVIRRLNAAFNAEDWDGFQAMLDPQVEFVDHMPLPDVAQSAKGVDEVRTVLEHWREGFSGFQAQVTEYLDMGDYVVCSTRWNFISRDGAVELEWPGAEAHEVRDGLLVWSAVGFPDVPAAVREVEQRQAS